MSLETAITFKFFCAKCRSVLDVKDYAPCRVYDGGFNGMSINPLPCDTCLEAARGNAVASHEARMKGIRDLELSNAVSAARKDALAQAKLDVPGSLTVVQLKELLKNRRRDERNKVKKTRRS